MIFATTQDQSQTTNKFTNLLLRDNKGLELDLEDSEDISGNPSEASEASSATNEVVIFKRGTLNILEIRLNTEIETPTAASSTGPVKEDIGDCQCQRELHVKYNI